ncbi:MAG: NTP transferase domain-containing protein [Alphaproteobacteria bacterium]|nr:NTP transferase domain-containing protein [Alphaproteobacteria bacterium]
MKVAIVLAAGGSSRMGRPKPLLPWGERTLVEAQVRGLQPHVDRVVVVVGAEEEAVRRVLPRSALVVTAPDWERTGPSDSARLGLAAVPEARVALVTPVDVVPAPASWLLPLLCAGGTAVPVSPEGRRGHPILLAGDALARLRSSDPLPEGLRTLLNGAREVPVPSPLVAEDFDTPGAYEAIRRAALGPDALEVLVDAEHGHASYTWRPGLSERDLAAWFRGVDATDGATDRWMAVDLVGTIRPVPPAELDAFRAAWIGGTRWTAHVHTVDDSWLRAPDGRELRPWLADEVQVEALRRRRQAVEDVWEAAVGVETPDELEEILARCPLPLERWLDVDLSWHRLGVGVGRVLGEARALRAVQRLDLSGNGVGPDDARALVDSPHFGASWLTFHDGLEQEVVAILARAPSVTRIDLGKAGVVHTR